MEIVTARNSSFGDQQQQGRRRLKASDGHVVAQLLDSPLPTPRRSCCGSAADTSRSARAASPQRTHVPFSWESSPGVPKVDACGGRLLERGVLPPKPPPGRGGTGIGIPCHGNTTTDATSSDDDEDDTFSDALERISSSDRLAGFSARLTIDGTGSRRFSSFIMDRFLPAANAIATTSAEKHPKKSPRRRERCSKHDKEAPAAASRGTRSLRRAPAGEQPKLSPRHGPAFPREERATPPQQSKDADLAQPARRLNEEAHAEQMSPRACGFMVLFPWSVKPVLCGFPRSPARCRTPRSDVGAEPCPPRRSTTLGDVLVKESRLRNDDLSHWYEEKSGSGKEWSPGPGLGMAILGTSKRYCADARRALSRLARSATEGGGGGSPRISGRERRNGKPDTSPPRSTSGRMPQLKPPSDSWLSHARGSNTVKV